MALSPNAVQWGRSLLAPGPQTTVGADSPAPVGGVNAADSLFSMSGEDAVYLYNMVPSDLGCRVRKGYVEWANGSTGSGLDDVRTILPFTGEDGTKKLFCATKDGIYDITSSTTNPTLVVDYSTVPGFTTAGNAGWCIYEQFTNDAAGTYLLVADEANGYFHYDGSTWDTAPTLSGSITDPTTVAHVRVWKNRVWLTEEDSGTAHYLGLGAIQGPASPFYFGRRFSHGGVLLGIWSYTRDGGDGIDDFLIAISSGGDVLIYQGYDPDFAATFDQRGSWYIGDVPVGRRIASEFGGDLLILSTYGIMAMSKILTGQSISEPDFYVTYRIAPLVRKIMQTEKDSRGWEIRVHNREGILILNTPRVGVNPYIQFVMDVNRGSWCVFRGVPILCSDVWQNNLYFGTSSTGLEDEGRVYYHSGNIDNVLLDGSNDGLITWGGLTAFDNHGAPGKWKRSQFIRPVFTSVRNPGYKVEPRYDFDISELTGTVGFNPLIEGDVWDSAIWDSAIWGAGGDEIAFESLRGGRNMGRHVAYSFKGESDSETILLGFSFMEDAGGLL